MHPSSPCHVYHRVVISLWRGWGCRSCIPSCLHVESRICTLPSLRGEQPQNLHSQPQSLHGALLPDPPRIPLGSTFPTHTTCCGGVTPKVHLVRQQAPNGQNNSDKKPTRNGVFQMSYHPDSPIKHRLGYQLRILLYDHIRTMMIHIAQAFAHKNKN